MENTLNIETFEIAPCDTVSAFGREAVMVQMFDHASGRVPVLVVFTDNGSEGMPFLDECRLVRKHIGRATPHKISDECAERLVSWARSGRVG